MRTVRLQVSCMVSWPHHRALTDSEPCRHICTARLPATLPLSMSGGKSAFAGMTPGHCLEWIVGYLRSTTYRFYPGVGHGRQSLTCLREACHVEFSIVTHTMSLWLVPVLWICGLLFVLRRGQDVSSMTLGRGSAKFTLVTKNIQRHTYSPLRIYYGIRFAPFV